MEIKINKEIKEYTETMFFGLSVRQFIFALLACGAAVGIYFGCRSFLGTETLSWLCMVGAAPVAALGFIRYNGMTAEQLVRVWFRSEVRMPRRLLFRGTNTLVRAEKRGNMFEKSLRLFQTGRLVSWRFAKPPFRQSRNRHNLLRDSERNDYQ